MGRQLDGCRGGRDVDDELFARLQRHYDDDTIAEMTMIIAWAICFMAGGIWMPARPALLRVREAIAAQPTALARLTSAPGFRRRFDGLSEEAKLRRVPREFPPDHPAAEWLKLQSFTARASIEPSVVTSPRLVERLCRDFELLVPLVRWLNRALGYQPARARQ